MDDVGVVRHHVSVSVPTDVELRLGNKSSLETLDVISIKCFKFLEFSFMFILIKEKESQYTTLMYISMTSLILVQN